MNSGNAHADKSCIALIGFRGSGKSAVAGELADLLGGEDVDTDKQIAEHAGCSITRIFENEGEPGFRRREAQAVAQVVADPPAVISLGGGAILDARNVAALKTVATIVFLAAPAEELWRRIAEDPATATLRPRLSRLVGLEEVRHLLTDRQPLYAAAADLTIDTSGKSPRQVAREIADRIEELRITNYELRNGRRSGS